VLFDFIFTQLNLKANVQPVIRPLVTSLLKEGYSTTDLRPFILEFRRRLARLDRVHDKIEGNKTSVSALRDLSPLSRHCKLTLAATCSQPAEVVAENSGPGASYRRADRHGPLQPLNLLPARLSKPWRACRTMKPKS